MKKITSVNNETVKETVKLQQKKYRNGLFLIEGIKSLSEAVISNIEIIKIFVKEGFKAPLEWQDFDIYEVTETVIKKISTTETPPEIVAVARQKKYCLEDMLQDENPIIIAIENIKDAGNLGTIIRTAAAANISGIILIGETVDLYNSKTVRAAVGNLWKIPVVEFEKKEDFKKVLLNYRKCKFFATIVNNSSKPVNYFKADFKGPSIIMFGSEAEGLSKELMSQADCFITIPMHKKVESLNLSVSVGIIVYESLRQRLYE